MEENKMNIEEEAIWNTFNTMLKLYPQNEKELTMIRDMRLKEIGVKK